MRDAPVLVKVANPSSQDRTPHGAILFAVLPAAAPYRASGFVQWRKAAIRSIGANGEVVLHAARD